MTGYLPISTNIYQYLYLYLPISTVSVYSKEAEMRKSVESRPGGWSGWRRLRLVDKVRS